MTYDAEELSNSKQKLCMYFGKAVRLIFELSRSNQMMDHEKLFLIKISIQQLKMKKSLRKIKPESCSIFSHYSYFNRLFSNY